MRRRRCWRCLFLDLLKIRENDLWKKSPPEFLPYASHYMAMLMGRAFLKTEKIALEDISHRNFEDLKQRFGEKQGILRKEAVDRIEQALKECYGDRDISLQQLAGTFRRGDLLEMLRETR